MFNYLCMIEYSPVFHMLGNIAEVVISKNQVAMRTVG